MCFDTNSINSGIHKGACTLIEKLFKKELLYLASRHHSHEIIVSDVFKRCFGLTNGPDVLIFKRFKEQLNFINQEENQCLSDEDLKDDRLKHLKDETVILATKCFQTGGKQPMYHHMEFLELTLLFLYEISPRGKQFNTSGVFHHGRWLSISTV